MWKNHLILRNSYIQVSLVSMVLTRTIEHESMEANCISVVFCIDVSLPMCGLIAQLVEHRTGEVTGLNPVEALLFSGFFSNC